MNYTVKQLQSSFDLSLMFGYGIDKYVQFMTESGLPYSNVDIAATEIEITRLKSNIPSTAIFGTKTESTSDVDLREYRITESSEYRITEIFERRIIQ